MYELQTANRHLTQSPPTAAAAAKEQMATNGRPQLLSFLLTCFCSASLGVIGKLPSYTDFLCHISIHPGILYVLTSCTSSTILVLAPEDACTAANGSYYASDFTCYVATNLQLRWRNALNFCSSRTLPPFPRASLISPRDGTQVNFLQATTEHHQYWTAGFRLDPSLNSSYPTSWTWIELYNGSTQHIGYQLPLSLRDLSSCLMALSCRQHGQLLA